MSRHEHELGGVFDPGASVVLVNRRDRKVGTMKPSANVRSSINGDGIILLDVTTGQIFSANPVGARIWSGLEEGLSIGAIVDRIAAETGADRTIVERDAADFVNTLRVRALVAEA
jgi:hypothetical protein